MRGKSVCAVAVLAMLLLVFMSIAPSQAADYSKPGVKQYDIATYSHSSTVFVADSVRVTVKNVSGALVSLTWWWGDLYFDYTINVTSGTNMDPPGEEDTWHFMVVANLSAGDAVATSYPQYWFNETINNYYIAGRNWTVNHISVVNASYTLDAYFDKATGWMLKYYRFINSVYNNFTLTSLVNVPPSSEEVYPLNLVLAISISALIVVSVVVLIVNRRAHTGHMVAGSAAM